MTVKRKKTLRKISKGFVRIHNVVRRLSRFSEAIPKGSESPELFQVHGQATRLQRHPCECRGAKPLLDPAAGQRGPRPRSSRALGHRARWVAPASPPRSQASMSPRPTPRSAIPPARSSQQPAAAGSPRNRLTRHNRRSERDHVIADLDLWVLAIGSGVRTAFAPPWGPVSRPATMLGTQFSEERRTSGAAGKA